ncbi:MAG: Hsp70 family protein, partial [Clostridia bacterium]|nr:Hsp70 family protein [Clostridia bacterium]
GIVHVSAKDKGTGKEQAITITSNTSMSKEDIEKAVNEAEQYAEEDKKRREAVDIRNNADQMVYQAEKTLTDAGDKITDDDKAPVNAAIEALKEALKGEDIETIKAKQEELQKSLYAVAEKLYQQAPQGEAQPGADAQGTPEDNVYDAEFTETDEN